MLTDDFSKNSMFFKAQDNSYINLNGTPKHMALCLARKLS